MKRLLINSSLIIFIALLSTTALSQNRLTVAEKVYLHLDRILYNTGDDIWFKSYVIDPVTNLLSLNTNNLHVELVAPDAKIILSRTLRIEGGLGNGDFNIPDSIPSGNYRVRAYTNHMRNFDDAFFFLKEIKVINPTDNGQGFNIKSQDVESRIDITFFPEGGSLVQNITSTVAFKAVDASGKGIDVTGKVYSSSGDLINTFKSTHLGIGFFEIKPIHGLTYYAVALSKNGDETKTILPEIFQTGVTLSALETIDKKLLITLNTNPETLPSLIGQSLYLTVSSGNLINTATKIEIASLVNNFLLPADYLKDGIIRITLAKNDGLPLCERLVYYQKHNEVSLTITMDKTLYKPKEKVTTEISFSDDSSLTVAAELSCSVADSRYSEDIFSFPSSITSWFLLESDVHGPVEEPDRYFDPSNKNRFEELDLLLLTQGWRDFEWKYDSANSFGSEVGFTISGNLKKALSDKPNPEVKINMGLFANKAARFFTAQTDSLGRFEFKDLDITGEVDAFITATSKTEGNKGRLFLDSVRYVPPALKEMKSEKANILPSNYSLFQQEAAVRFDIKKKYKLSDTLNIGEVIITAKKTETQDEIKIKESRRVYGIPDKELVITPVMEKYPGDVFSFLSGRIGGVRQITGSGGETVGISIRGQGMALILMDGAEVNPDSYIIVTTLPIYMIDRIDVLEASPLYGMRGANGVVNIITRKGMRRSPAELTPNTAAIKLNGFDAPRIFYSPKYDNASAKTYLPDTRTTIFWEPNISIREHRKAILNYFNADDPAKISIIVEGITTEGIPVTRRASYEVK